MGLSFWQIAIVVLLLVLLFGRGKISDLMGDVAKGIKSFKKGMAEEDIDSAEIKQDPKVIDQKSETDVKDIKSKKTNS
ncbi:MAG: twin-arginine translocase TatA/TatE family subunit [Emcibacter sp.]|nr:twin-arginine translocase TatA/TatE family subunit [Emcibacter sp.]